MSTSKKIVSIVILGLLSGSFTTVHGMHKRTKRYYDWHSAFKSLTETKNQHASETWSKSLAQNV